MFPGVGFEAKLTHSEIEGNALTNCATWTVASVGKKNNHHVF